MPEFLKRSIIRRILGIPATSGILSRECWQYSDNVLIVDLKKVDEFPGQNSAVRVEDNSLPERILLVKDNSGEFHAFRNRCSHMGRRLDPLPDGKHLQCCSVNKSTFTFKGDAIYGPVKHGLHKYEVNLDGEKLSIRI